MTRQFFQTVSMAAAIALGASAAIGSFSQPSYANTFPNTTFSCLGAKLLATNTGASVPVELIRFTGTSAPTKTGSQRCQEVLSQFNTANTNDQLTFITTDVKNGLNVVCGVSNYGNTCTSLGGNTMLFTLTHHKTTPQAAQKALEQLFFRLHSGKPTADPLLDTESRIYIDMREYLREAFAEEGGSAESSQR